MSKNRDDEPGYYFCCAETKEELARRAVTEFLGWVLANGNDHDVWTIPEEENDVPNKTV